MPDLRGRKLSQRGTLIPIDLGILVLDDTRRRPPTQNDGNHFDMLPKELAAHKLAPKRLVGIPAFRAMKKGKLPKPLHKMGGPRLHATDLTAVSDTHRAVFIWRDGELLTDSAFFGYLFQVLADDELSPLVEFHLHPSHKGLHIKVPCDTLFDYRQRLLPGAPELALSGISGLDPRR